MWDQGWNYIKELAIKKIVDTGLTFIYYYPSSLPLLFLL